MITKVTIHVGAKNLHFERVFTDSEELTKECDSWLMEHDLANGCTGFNPDQTIALNAIFADAYDDVYNMNNYCECEDVSDRLWQAINDRMDTVVTDDDVVAIANVLGINVNEI